MIIDGLGITFIGVDTVHSKAAPKLSKVELWRPGNRLIYPEGNFRIVLSSKP